MKSISFDFPDCSFSTELKVVPGDKVTFNVPCSGSLMFSFIPLDSSLPVEP